MSESSLNHRRPEDFLLNESTDDRRPEELLFPWNESDWEAFERTEGELLAASIEREFNNREFEQIDQLRQVALQTRAEIELYEARSQEINHETNRAWTTRQQSTFERDGLTLAQSVDALWQDHDEAERDQEELNLLDSKTDQSMLQKELQGEGDQERKITDSEGKNMMRARRRRDARREKITTGTNVAMLRSRIERGFRELKAASPENAIRFLAERKDLQAKLAELNIPLRPLLHEEEIVHAKGDIQTKGAPKAKFHKPQVQGPRIDQVPQKNRKGQSPILKPVTPPLPHLLNSSHFAGTRPLKSGQI